MKEKVIIIVLCLIMLILGIGRTKNKFVFVNNKEKNICQKCVIIEGNYYCQIYSIDKESDK